LTDENGSFTGCCFFFLLGDKQKLGQHQERLVIDYNNEKLTFSLKKIHESCMPESIQALAIVRQQLDSTINNRID
jgi:hypothetical protein